MNAQNSIPERTSSPCRSSTPPSRKLKAKVESRRKNNRVEFSPLSSAPRRGSFVSESGGSGHGAHGKLQSKESVDREKQRRLVQVAKARDRREKVLKIIRREKKFMLFSSMLAFLALFVWFIAVFTSSWCIVTQSEENLEAASNTTTPSAANKDVFIYSKTGLWKTCAYYYTNIKTQETRVECSYFSIFLTSREEANLANQESPNTLNQHVIDYTRAQICFATISVLLMTMTIVAAFYTFKNSRYVYKRLAACLYFMTTISVLVVLEVLVTSVHYSDSQKLYPEGAIVKYGYSFYMGWSVFLVYLVNGCIFVILSRKRKYDKDDDSDGDFITGR